MTTYRRIPADPGDFFGEEEVKKAKDYQRPQTVVRAISLALNAVLLLAVITTGAADAVADAVVGDDAGWVIRLIVIMVAFMVVSLPIDIPIAAWTTFKHEKKWGFSTQTPRGFAMDQVKNLILGIAIQTPLLLVLWWAIRSTEMWWLWGWAAFFVFSIVLAFLFPVVIMPIFNKFTPLEDEELAGRLHRVVEKAGMKVSGVQVMDASKRTRKDNAFFAGLGKTRRVVLFDNLLQQSHPVIESVVAHELGHWRRRHVARLVVIGTLTTLFLFGVLRLVSTFGPALDWAGIEDFSDPAALPLVLLTFVVASSVTGVAQAWVSRAFERQADLDALDITQDYDAFVETEHGLSTRNLIDLAPNWWRYIRASHPPPAERLQLAKDWQRDAASAKAT
ncbi:MAG: M48 family metallopeptidase [Actinomycetota bacterium]